jgi:hypothetical protein
MLNPVEVSSKTASGIIEICVALPVGVRVGEREGVRAVGLGMEEAEGEGEGVGDGNDKVRVGVTTIGLGNTTMGVGVVGLQAASKVPRPRSKRILINRLFISYFQWGFYLLTYWTTTLF